MYETLVSRRDRTKPLVYSQKAWTAARLVNAVFGGADRMKNVVTENGYRGVSARAGMAPAVFVDLNLCDGYRQMRAVSRLKRAGCPSVGSFFYSLSAIDFMDPFDYSRHYPQLERYRRSASRRLVQSAPMRVRQGMELAEAGKILGIFPFEALPVFRIPKEYFSGKDLSAGGRYEVFRDSSSVMMPDGTRLTWNTMYLSARKSKTAFVMSASSHTGEVCMVNVPWNRGIRSVTVNGADAGKRDPYSGAQVQTPMSQYYASLYEGKRYLESLGITSYGVDRETLVHEFGLSAGEADAVNRTPASAIRAVPAPISHTGLSLDIRDAFDKAVGMMPVREQARDFAGQTAYARDVIAYFFKRIADTNRERVKGGRKEPELQVHAQQILLLFHDYTTLAKNGGGLMIKDMVLGTQLSAFSAGAVFSAILWLIQDGVIEADWQGNLLPAELADTAPDENLRTVLYVRHRLIKTLSDAGVGVSTARALVKEYTDNAVAHLDRMGVMPPEQAYEVLRLYAPSVERVCDSRTGTLLLEDIRKNQALSPVCLQADLVGLGQQALRGKLRLKL